MPTREVVRLGKACSSGNHPVVLGSEGGERLEHPPASSQHEAGFSPFRVPAPALRVTPQRGAAEDQPVDLFHLLVSSFGTCGCFGFRARWLGASDTPTAVFEVPDAGDLSGAELPPSDEVL